MYKKHKFNFFPEMSGSDFEAFKDSFKDGFKESLGKVILYEGMVLDGWNRYKACLELGISAVFEQFKGNESEAFEYSIASNLNRRHLTSEQRDYLIGIDFNSVKKPHGGDRSKTPNWGFEKTSKILQEKYNLGKNTIERAGNFAKGVDVIAQVQPDKKDEILNGESNLTKQEVQEFSKIEKQAQKEVKKESFFENDTEINAKIEEKAKILAEAKLKELEIKKKNHFARVASKIKDNNVKPQSVVNNEIVSEINAKYNEIYTINDRHKLIIFDSFEHETIKKHLPKETTILTDPPYGISYKSPSGSGMTNRGNYDIIKGDNTDFNPDILLKYSDKIITWGANHYANKLPLNSAGWLVWDKRDGKAINNNSDCELAWTNILNSARLFHHTWNGMLKASEKGSKRVHPTQKPIKLFEWCIQIAKIDNTVLDLFGGSGSTLIACDNQNIDCIIVEKSIEYANTMINRFKNLNYKIQYHGVCE